MEPLSASLIRLTVASVVIWVIAFVGRRAGATITALRQHPRAGLRLTGGAVAGPVIGVWLSLVAVQRTSVGIASTLTSLTPIFLIPISYVVFRSASPAGGRRHADRFRGHGAAVPVKIRRSRV
ncbi:MAG: EamA family transporter [Anaerolineae bacterium]